MGQSIDKLLADVRAEGRDKLSEILSTPGPEPSEPGEPPHKQSGDLLESYTFDATYDGETIVVTMQSPLPYADALEYGTDRMAARPHRQPLADWLAQTLPDRLAEAVQLDLLETLEPQGPAAEPPPTAGGGGFFAGVRSFFGF